MSTTTTTKTTKTTRSSEPAKIYSASYKSSMTPRNTTFVQRTSMGSPGGSMMSRSVTRSSMGYGGGVQSIITPQAFANITSSGVVDVRESRVQEKKDMQDLNERFASYIEKVRFLEAQNRRLADELDKLKQKWGQETSAIKAMYQTELEESRKLLDESEKEKARLEIKCSSLEEKIDELRAELDDLAAQRAIDVDRLARQDEQLSEYESEIALLRRRLESMENDRAKDKKEIARLQETLNRTRIDLDNESLNHIDAENRRQTLEEELEFMKQVHEQEMKELAALAYRDTTAENREFWKSEMSQALHEIQQTYDEKLETMRGDLESFYNFKIQEMRTGATRQNMESTHSKEENKRLRQQMGELRAKLNELEGRNAMLEREVELLRREYADKEREWELESTELTNEVAKLRAEMEAMLKELQDLLDTKLGLELEIAAYRKLLEGEESRVGLRRVVDDFVGKRTDEAMQVTEEVRQIVEAQGGVYEESDEEDMLRSERQVTPITIEEITRESAERVNRAPLITGVAVEGAISIKLAHSDEDEILEIVVRDSVEKSTIFPVEELPETEEGGDGKDSTTTDHVEDELVEGVDADIELESEREENASEIAGSDTRQEETMSESESMQSIKEDDKVINDDLNSYSSEQDETSSTSISTSGVVTKEENEVVYEIIKFDNKEGSAIVENDQINSDKLSDVSNEEIEITLNSNEVITQNGTALDKSSDIEKSLSIDNNINDDKVESEITELNKELIEQVESLETNMQISETVIEKEIEITSDSLQSSIIEESQIIEDDKTDNETVKEDNDTVETESNHDSIVTSKSAEIESESSVVIINANETVSSTSTTANTSEEVHEAVELDTTENDSHSVADSVDSASGDVSASYVVTSDELRQSVAEVSVVLSELPAEATPRDVVDAEKELVESLVDKVVSDSLKAVEDEAENDAENLTISGHLSENESEEQNARKLSTADVMTVQGDVETEVTIVAEDLQLPEISDITREDTISEEVRVDHIDFSEQDEESSSRSSQVVRGEMSAKTTYQKSAKGSIAICECSADGKFIIIENTGRKEENLNNWTIARSVDGNDKDEFILDDVKIRPNGRVKIYSSGSKPSSLGPNEFVYDGDNWGIGAHVITKLSNQHREEKASHIQKTVYTS